MSGYTGISYPFRFNGAGGVAKSSTSMDDFSHIQESIIQIVLTRIGEREFETSFGSEVTSQLFKGNDDESVLSILKFYITQSLELWETRISVSDIFIEPIEDNNGDTVLQCTINYEVVRYMSSGSVTLNLSI